MERFSKREAYRNGLAILQAALKGEQRGDETKQIPFHGFGALKELLLPLDNLSLWSAEDRRYEKEVFQFHDLLEHHFKERYKPAVASLKSSLLSSFYTPDFIIEPMVEAAKDFHPDIKSILEPAAGTGNFIGILKKHFPDASITAIEKDDTAHKVLTFLHPDIEAIHGSYENFRNRSADLVISNIPFGNINVFDDAMFREAIPVKVKATTRIHNYYFVKSLDNLKEGGILALVAPSGVMDSPGNQEIRQYLVKQANLVATARLPNTTFEQAGTYPVTDVILLQKDSGKKRVSPAEQLFISSEKTEVLNAKGEGVMVDINGYYLENRHQVLGTLLAGGQYDGRSLDVAPLSGANAESIRVQLRDVMTKPVQELVPVTTRQEESPALVTNKLPVDHPLFEQLKRGNLIVHRGKPYTIDIEGEDKRLVPQPPIKDLDRAVLFTDLRNTMVRLIQAELDGQLVQMKTLRSELNARYDLFSFRYGNLNHPANKKLCLLDAEGFKILSLEKLQGKQYAKADLFEKQVNNVTKNYERPETLRDAILISLNTHNKIDVDFISSLLDKNRHNVIREGLDTELLFRDIDQDRYVTRDEFLSGNVVSKTESLERARQNEDKEKLDALSTHDIDNHLQRLRAVRPTYLKRELIDINLGERWIPLDIYEGFAEHIFKTPTQMNYLGSVDSYRVQPKTNSNEERITYAATIYNGKITGRRLLEYAMADTQPYLQIRIPGTDPPQYKPDVDGMKNVEMKIKEIKDEFEKFLNTRKDISERIEELYNRTINNTVRRDYDGSHLQLSGLKHFSPRSHQKDALWMILQQDGGIIDHVVGAGKTLVMVTAAVEMKRLGLAQKPLILCMKANVADVAADFLKAYPSAKILAPDPAKDFTPQKRKTIFASIAANDWDAVILTHDMFKAIEQSPKMKMEVLTHELSNLEDDLAVLSEDKSLSKRMLKGLEVRKENLVARIKEMDASIKRDENILDFEKMGFDHLIVDESHEFKNLHFTTRHQQVAGLGNPAGSQRAINLEFAIRTIQEKKGGDKGVTFLSGTTISNSLVELYLIFKYLRPEKLKSLRINSFDAWAKMYARKSASYEFSVTNELKVKERYREFIKVPELARFYAEIAHVVTDLTLKVDKPKVENIVVNIDPTQQQADYTEKLIRFTQSKNPAHVDLQLDSNQLNALMLIATNLAKKMSIDMRLINPDRYSFEEDSKVGKLCKTVAKEYNESTHFRGTQLVFSDMGTPGGNTFDLYNEIKRILVTRHGISPTEIQFIHDHDTKQKRSTLFQKVNRGEVRILLGGTKKLGTGVNVQERVIAMHHVDIPWRPSDLEQRTGRGGRQGNRIAREYRDNIVQNYIYAVNRTLDAYQFNVLANKQKFILQIKNNSIELRKIDEGAFDQEGGMNFAEYVALLSGNTDLLEKVKLEKKLADLERSYQVFMKRKSEAEFNIKLIRNGQEMKEKALARLESDWKPFQGVDLEKLPLTIGGKTVEDKKEAGSQLQALIAGLQKDQSTGKETAVASLQGFDLMYNHQKALVHVKGMSGQIYNYASGSLNEDSALTGRYLHDCVKRIPRLIDNEKADFQRSTSLVETYSKELAAEFKDKALIRPLKQQIEELNQRIEKATSRADIMSPFDRDQSLIHNPKSVRKQRQGM